jgi:tRNA(adenine34) deaminase
VLAKEAKENGNAPVGCIICKEDQVIAKAAEAGHSKGDITCHAEIEAIRIARQRIGPDLSDCVMITTHEPCVMCSYAIRFHKLKAIIYKNKVAHLGGISSSMNLLISDETPKHWGKAPQIIQFPKI